MRLAVRSTMLAAVAIILGACGTSRDLNIQVNGCSLRPIYQSEFDRAWIGRLTAVSYTSMGLSDPHIGRADLRHSTIIFERVIKGVQNAGTREIEDIDTGYCGLRPAAGDRVVVYERGPADKPGHFVMVRSFDEARRLDRALRNVR